MLMTTLLMALAQAATPAPAASAHIVLDGNRITVEIAADEASRQHGLMDRKHLDHDQGMLFVFPDDAPRAFWMKNTLIPLDMLFFDDAGKLVSMQLNVPPCKHDPCPSYPSNEAARYVLELPAGAVDRMRVHQGDVMKLPPGHITAR